MAAPTATLFRLFMSTPVKRESKLRLRPPRHGPKSLLGMESNGHFPFRPTFDDIEPTYV